jgi:hypothetical protein
VNPTLLWLKNAYWIHREAWRIGAALGGVALVQLVIVLWVGRRLRELSHMRERMARLADGLALLTDTTEAGFATVVREVQQMARKSVTRPSPGPRAAVAKRVVAAAKNGNEVASIASAEALSESEVRLHLKLADGSRLPLGDNPLMRMRRAL